MSTIDAETVGVAGASLVVLAGVVLVVGSLVRDDTTTVVFGSSTIMLGSVAVMLLSQRMGDDAEAT